MSTVSPSHDPRPVMRPGGSADAVGRPEPATRIVYGVPGAAAAAFQRAQDCGCALTDEVAALRSAITARDLWVLHEIDPQALLRRSGMAIGPGRQILFFHLRYVARLLAADPAAIGEAPLKVVLLELPGGLATVRWFDPAPALSRNAHPDLTLPRAGALRALRRHRRDGLLPARTGLSLIPGTDPDDLIAAGSREGRRPAPLSRNRTSGASPARRRRRPAATKRPPRRGRLVGGGGGSGRPGAGQ